MKSFKALEFAGAVLTILGSFLPWEHTGGFANLNINGLWVDVVNFRFWFTGIYEFPVHDYGGAVIVLLTLIGILLTNRRQILIKHTALWNLIVVVILMASSLFFLGRGLLHRYEYNTTIEQPGLMFGLYIVVFGSSLLLWRAIMLYRQAAKHKDRSMG